MSNLLLFVLCKLDEMKELFSIRISKEFCLMSLIVGSSKGVSFNSTTFC